MRKFLTVAIISVLALAAMPAFANVRVGIGVGGGYYGGGYYGRGYYGGYPYYPGYYAPPVVYAPYVEPPPVVYVSPPQTVYYAPPAIAADQTSPTFVDNLGRTCRAYQSGAVTGKACLQPDGSWRVTP